MEDTASQIKDGYITVHISCTNICYFCFIFIASTYASSLATGLGLKFLTMGKCL